MKKSRLLSAVCAYLFILATTASHAAGVLMFEDTNNPTYPTSITGINLTTYGFDRYDVFFVSNREDVLDGWAAVETAYSSDFAPDIFPSTSNSELLSHHIKQEIVRIFNTNSIELISGLTDPGSMSYEHHSALGVQTILIPYRLGEVGTTEAGDIQGTFLVNNLPTGWNPDADDLTSNTFGNGANSGTDRNYWAIVTNTAVVPIPAAFWLFGSGLLGLIGMARKKAS